MRLIPKEVRINSVNIKQNKRIREEITLKSEVKVQESPIIAYLNTKSF